MKILPTMRPRKAISPIIATILIIAVTLIAAVAIGGFVFGLFGASSSTAQVQAINAALIHPTATVASLGVTCQITAPAGGNFVQLSNLGTANAVVTAVSITYGGVVYPAQLTSCSASPVVAGQSLYLWFTGYPALASSGAQFSGFSVMNNGAQVVFAGSFA